MPVKLDPQSVGGTQVNYTRSFAGVETSTAFRTSQTWIDSRSGVENLEWRKAVRAGRNATTSYTASFQTASPLNCSATATVTRADKTYSTRSISGHLTGWWGTPPNPSDRGLSVADLAARQQFVSQYRSRRTQFQSGVFFGEIMKTVNMIRNPASALRNGLDRYHSDVKRRLKRSKHPQRTVRDTWLEYSFGWTPLINDVADAARLAIADPFAYQEVLQATSRDVQVDVRGTGATSNSFLQLYFLHRSTGYGQVRYKGAIRAEVSPPSFPEQLGLSWSNVLPTVWELIPYSFLIDYFTNVGRVIEGISEGPIRLAWGCKTTIRKGQFEIERTWYDEAFLKAQTPLGGTSSAYALGSGVSRTATLYDRYPISNVSVGIGDFRFKVPSRWRQWFNIAALARLRS